MTYYYFVSFIGDIGEKTKGTSNAIVDFEERITKIEEIEKVEKLLMNRKRWKNIIITSLNLL